MRHFASIQLLIKPLLTKGSWAWAAFAVTLLLFSASSALTKLEQHSSLGWLFHLRGPKPAPPGVVIAALNTRAHGNLGLTGPAHVWPRPVIAELINTIKRQGAALIILDIAFKELKTPEQDAPLAGAIEHAGNVVLFSYLKRQQIMLGEGLADIEQLIRPPALFLKHALGTGSFTLPKEKQVFYTRLYNNNSGAREPSQPLLAFNLLQNTAPPPPAAPFFINFYGPAKTLPTVDADVLLQGTSPPSQISGKAVYIGVLETAQTEQVDSYRTVFSNRYGVDLSGVEISATVLANLLEQSQIKPLPYLPRVILLALILAGSISATRLNRKLKLSVVCGLTILSWWLSWWLFSKEHIWLPATTITAFIVAPHALHLVLRYREQKQKISVVSHALSQHLPNHAAQKLSRRIVRLEREHDTVQGVCLVTDIKGYTALAEATPPGQLHELMNTYYEQLVACVETHQGFVANIVGDSLVALWTAPVIDTTLCQKGLQCALDIRERLQSEPSLSALPTCFALHAGDFSLGHLGAQGHFEYSPVGDMINTATRIEHINRDLGTNILCSKQVAGHLLNTGQYKWRCLGDFKLRNKSRPVSLYTPE